MFRHSKKAPEEGGGEEVNKEVSELPSKKAAAEDIKETKDMGVNAMRELLEKNLKWSQIIYEQNRRVNNKLFWMALAGWIRVFIILVPLVFALIYLPPIVQDLWNKYQSLLNSVGSVNGDAVRTLSPTSIEQILKLLPLDTAKQEQLKAMLN